MLGLLLRSIAAYSLCTLLCRCFCSQAHWPISCGAGCLSELHLLVACTSAGIQAAQLSMGPRADYLLSFPMRLNLRVSKPAHARRAPLGEACVWMQAATCFEGGPTQVVPCTCLTYGSRTA